MDEIKVSVCMVTYNHERFIAQAVESALAQETTFPVEIVIGEDCSTDGTRAIVRDLAERHPDRVRLRMADRNQGAKANSMETLKRCRGQYIALLEGDDYWTSPQKLQRQIEALDARPDWAMCFHPTRIIAEDGSQEPRIAPANWERPEATLVDLFKENFIPTSAVVFRNRLFEALPAWYHESQLGDWPLHILNAAHGKIGFISDVMSVYRIHAHGIWSGLDAETQLTTIFKMFTSVDHHFAGRYAREIDEFRLNTLRWLLNERDLARSRGQELAALQHDTAVLRQEHVALQQAARRLSEENAALNHWRDAPRAPRRSLAVRIVRRARRPLQQVWQRAQRWLGRSAEP